MLFILLAICGFYLRRARAEVNYFHTLNISLPAETIVSQQWFENDQTEIDIRAVKNEQQQQAFFRQVQNAATPRIVTFSATQCRIFLSGNESFFPPYTADNRCGEFQILGPTGIAYFCRFGLGGAEANGNRLLCLYARTTGEKRVYHQLGRLKILLRPGAAIHSQSVLSPY